MAAILETELLSDLETLYKIAGDLLNDIEEQKFEDNPLMETVKFRLEDISGTLQKDIFTLRHIAMRQTAGNHGA